MRGRAPAPSSPPDPRHDQPLRATCAAARGLSSWPRPPAAPPTPGRRLVREPHPRQARRLPARDARDRRRGRHEGRPHHHRHRVRAPAHGHRAGGRSTAIFIETLEGEPLRFESTNKLAENDYTIRAERRGEVFLVTQEAMGKKTETEVPYAPDILFPNARRARDRRARAEARARSSSCAPSRPTPRGRPATVIECKGSRRSSSSRARRRRLLALRVDPGRDARGDPEPSGATPRATVQKTLLPMLGHRDRLAAHHAASRRCSDPRASSCWSRPWSIPRLRPAPAARHHPRALQAAPAQSRAPATLTAARGRPPAHRRPRRWQRRHRGQERDAGTSAKASRRGPDRRYLGPRRVLPDRRHHGSRRCRAGRRHAASPEAGRPRRSTRWVYRSIDKKSLSVGLATAAEVAREPDRRLHRARGARRGPGAARAASRRRWRWASSTSTASFGYHMWTEVFDEGWHALDPAFGQDAADATHIKLAESALDQGFIDEGLIGLVRVIANLDVEIVEYELDGSVRTPARRRPSRDDPRPRLQERPYGLARRRRRSGWHAAAARGRRRQGPLVRLEGPGGVTRRAAGARPCRTTSASADWVRRSTPASRTATRASDRGRPRRPGRQARCSRATAGARACSPSSTATRCSRCACAPLGTSRPSVAPRHSWRSTRSQLKSKEPIMERSHQERRSSSSAARTPIGKFQGGARAAQGARARRDRDARGGGARRPRARRRSTR